MAKVDIVNVENVLNGEVSPAEKVAEIVEKILKNQPKPVLRELQKKKFIFVRFPLVDVLNMEDDSTDPLKTLKGMEKQLDAMVSGWVVQIPEKNSEEDLLARIRVVVAEFNNSPKGRKIPVKKLADAFEFISARFWKKLEIWVKTKEPITVITPPNGFRVVGGAS